jgi:hypothetical protein
VGVAQNCFAAWDQRVPDVCEGKCSRDVRWDAQVWYGEGLQVLRYEHNQKYEVGPVTTYF